MKIDKVSREPPVNLIGQRFGRWKVLGISPHKNQGRQYLQCECDCGTLRDVMRYSILSGKSTSCGCLKLENIKKAVSLPSGVSGFNRLYKRYKKGAEGRNLPFSLSEEEFKALVESPCHYCGDTKTLVTCGNGTNNPYHHNGIDRVDNNYGYVAGNVAPCCSVCNSMKSILPYEMFLGQVGKIYDNLKERYY